VFCPRFFTDKVPFLNDLTNRKPSNGNMENNMFIIRETKEHTLLHEYMHADMAFWSLVDATGKQHDKPYSTDRSTSSVQQLITASLLESAEADFVFYSHRLEIP
jgi:hypothetical protein